MSSLAHKHHYARIPIVSWIDPSTHTGTGHESVFRKRSFPTSLTASLNQCRVCQRGLLDNGVESSGANVAELNMTEIRIGNHSVQSHTCHEHSLNWDLSHVELEQTFAVSSADRSLGALEMNDTAGVVGGHTRDILGELLN